MARQPRSVDQAIARFDQVAARLDGTAHAYAARRRHYGRTARSLGKRLGGMGIALLGLIVATILFSQLVAPIGLLGLFLVALLTLGVLVFFSIGGGSEPAQIDVGDEVPTARIAEQLESLLVRKAPALPAPAARQVDAITQTLPMLQKQLAEIPALDPLAQDARRLMGRHLPELIRHYESVPAPYRAERDGEGLTVDERLVAGLDATRTALTDVSAQLARGKRDALESHGRFIESRYKDPDGLGGQ